MCLGPANSSQLEVPGLCCQFLRKPGHTNAGVPAAVQERQKHAEPVALEADRN